MCMYSNVYKIPLGIYMYVWMYISDNNMCVYVNVCMNVYIW